MLDLGGGELGVEFVRVEYDLQRTVDAILRSDLPDEFAVHLQNGGPLLTVGST